MRILTVKQRAYLEKLKQRNAQLIQESNHEKTKQLWYQGLNNPMSSTERKMRQRIRRNAIAAMFDLVLISNAGLLPDRKIMKQGVKSIIDMLADVENFMIIRMVTAEKTEGLKP